MAYQSTDTSGGVYNAGLAVDDNTDMDFTSGSCSRTVGENAYWYVDLGDTYSIDYVNVYPATGYEGTLTGIEIRVDIDTSLLLTSTNICGSIPSQTSGHHLVDCNPSLIGRYVSLYKSNNNEITVCEVDVYGVHISKVPVVTCPADKILKTSSPLTLDWDAPIVTDDVDTGLVAICTPPSDSSFPPGSTMVTCTATDSHGNTRSCSFDVILDAEKPIVECPDNIARSISTFSQVTVTWNDPTVSDNVDTDLSAACIPSSGSSFNIGSTDVTCYATDTASNTGICVFTVTVNVVIDEERPNVECPGNIIRSISTSNQATVTWDDPTVSDNVDPDLSATCNPLSGSSFNIGSRVGTCYATDTAGNTGSCDFSVTVNDVGVPILTCPDIETGEPSVTWDDPIVIDNVDTGLSATCNPPSGSLFNIGSTDVTCNAMDTAGNTGICVFKVTVNDNDSPTVSCPVEYVEEDTGTLVTWDDPTVSDNADTDLSATCTPPSGSSFNIGSTNVTCTAMDTVNNVGSCVFTVTVKEATDNSPNTDDDDGGGGIDTTVIVIVLIAVLLLLVFAVVLAWKIRAKRQILKRPGVIPMSAPNGLRSGKEPEQTNNELLALGATNNQEDYSNYTPDPDPYVIQEFIQPAIPIHKLAEYIEEKKANEQLTQEWESLPEGIKTDARKSVGLESNNAIKNRYRNVIPYDEHRVVLDVIYDNPYSDYINACFIKGFVKENEYIAAQGPNKSTVVDFWRMIWQENVSVVIMTANLVEDGKNKCTQYWPENVNKYGELNVSFLKETSKTSYLTRKLKVVKGTEVRYVKQYHFFIWPDKNIPRSSSPVINMLNVINNETPSNAGPILVHCSAGAGRTGAIIAIDAMMKMATETGEINILEFVKDMRERRPNMVQTPLQYLFVYKTILEFVLFGDTSRAASDFKEHYQKLRAINPKSKKSYIADEFEALQGLSSILGGHKITGGFRPENRDKNRYPDLVPFDRNRPFIMTPGEDGPSDYINASFFDSFDKKDMFIGTQTPLENTIEDFWRMVVDYNSRAIVVLTDMVNRDRTVAEFWPDLNLQFSFKYLTVSSLTSEKLSRHINIHSFDITKNDEKKSLEVKIFEFLGWPANSFTPKSTADFLQLVTVVNNWQSEIEDPTMVVMCLDGLGRTGVFCATMSSLRRLLEEQTVDILQSVKLLRNNRLGMVQTLSQYEFIYKTILEHLLAFEVYDNVPQEEALYANV
ncbi:uncharacterized protein [Antedon mediterranea]|uniref:uncharacterized protein n=1 Tax=Antedon mediterranea TaxID=105859 RepID=UPI003AF67DAE